MIRRHIIFSGAVQGVGFRYRAVHAAARFRCTGWARNEWDGTVSMEIQGAPEDIDRVIEAIGRGTFVRIEDMAVRSLPVVPEERDFRAE